MAPKILDPAATKSEEKNIVRSRATNEEGKKQKDLSKINLSQDGQKTDDVASNPSEMETFRPQIRWPDLIAQMFIHLGSLLGLYYLICLKAKFYTYIWCEFLAAEFTTSCGE